MKPITSPADSGLRRTARAFCCALMLLSLLPAGCGKKDDPGDAKKNAGAGTEQKGAPGGSGGYLDSAGWAQAQGELKIVNEAVKAFNAFYDVWGWAYEHRVFQRFKEALTTAEALPGKMDEAVRQVDRIRTVPGYGEIDEMKNCYLKMIPLLRGGAEELRLSIIAARDHKGAEEKEHVRAYADKWKAAMEQSKRSFTVMQELLTRGSRVEYQAMTGGQKPAPASAADFRRRMRKITAEYDGTLRKKTAEIDALAGRGQWEGVLLKTDGLYTRLQALIIEAGQSDPGSAKDRWEVRQALITALSHQMIAVKKLGEYAEKRRSGDSRGAEPDKKVYEILRESASDARGRLKKLGY